MAQTPTEAVSRRHIKRDASQARGYSAGVVTQGGRIAWLAGQTAIEDASGKSLAGDFDGQVRAVFDGLAAVVKEAGGALSDIVTVTCYITDARYGPRLTEHRRQLFGDNFPSSVLVVVSGLARPEMLVEVQGIAVIGDA